MQPFENWNNEETNAAEAELRAELKRVAAPAGFADRLMARVETEQTKQGAQPQRGAQLQRGKLLMFRSPVARTWIGGAIAAMLTLGVFVGGEIRERREEQRRVQQEFDTAMRVTDHALEQTRGQLARAGISLGE